MQGAGARIAAEAAAIHTPFGPRSPSRAAGETSGGVGVGGGEPISINELVREGLAINFEPYARDVGYAGVW